jgi:ribosome biogenesis GTPase / thiamine phosphate phosphatase
VRAFEDFFEPEQDLPQMQDSLDLRALRDIGLTLDTVQAALVDDQHARPDCTRLARVIEVRRDHVLVHDGVDAHAVVPWPTLRVALELERDTLVVGDWVWWRPAVSDADRGWAVARIAARNRLTRRDPAGGRQGLVANIDTALLVMGLDGDFNLRRLDRFLVLAHSAQARSVVVLTKADRCDDPPAAVARVRAHLGAAGAHDGRMGAGAGGATDGVDVVAVDGRSPTAIDALAPWLARGSTLVMLGSSGAGKTTLTNTLCGTASLTSAVREGDERGQHTTTVRTLHLTCGGACLIDTPGLRQLWLDADAGELQGAFPEIGLLAAQCRYRNCRHESEPGCAVRATVPAERLRSFHKLLREVRRDQVDVFERRKQLAVYKQRTRASRRRQVERE